MFEVTVQSVWNPTGNNLFAIIKGRIDSVKRKNRNIKKKKTLHETVDLEELEETPDTEKPLQPSIRKSDNTNAVTPSDFPSDPEVNATTRSTFATSPNLRNVSKQSAPTGKKEHPKNKRKPEEDVSTNISPKKRGRTAAAKK